MEENNDNSTLNGNGEQNGNNEQNIDTTAENEALKEVLAEMKKTNEALVAQNAELKKVNQKLAINANMEKPRKTTSEIINNMFKRED